MSKKAEDLCPSGPVPDSAVRLFRMAWQLENWLRTMVYVELRANRVNWEELIKENFKDRPLYSQVKDKELNHMATHHVMALSYLTFGELWKIISSKDNWALFEPYFPPEANTATKIEEIKTIRNRVAHFREPHQNDEARFTLFLQDLEAGLRSFCNRYTTNVHLESDLVSKRLENVWEQVGYGYELYRPDRNWLYAPGHHRANPLMHATLEVAAHKRHKSGSAEGVIYGLEISPGLSKHLNVLDFLSCTRGLHSELIHVIVKSDDQVAVTIPAIHGPDKVVELIEAFLSAGINSSRAVRSSTFELCRKEWPEYILWPDHLLSFYDREMRGDIIQLPE